jgi:hypothetical protein
MKIEEINELVKEVFACPLKLEEKIGELFWSMPNPKVYDNESEGWKLCIKKTVVTKSSHDCLKSIVKKHKLKMKELKEGYLVIYTPRKA